MPARFLRIHDDAVDWTDGVQVAASGRGPRAGPQLLGPGEAETIAAWASERKTSSGPLTLVIPSSWCLIHSVHPAVRRPNHATLCYEFEAAVPWSAEKLTADFIRLPDGAHWGIAVRTDDVSPLVAALDRSGLNVERITLDVFDALATRVAASANRLIWCDTRHLSVLDLQAGKVVNLRCVRFRPVDSADDYAQLIESVGISSGEACVPFNLAIAGRIPHEWLESLRVRLGSTMPTSPAPHTATSVTPFNLARDALRPHRLHSGIIRSGRRCAVAVTIAGLIMMASFLVHSRQTRSELKAITIWEQEQFKRVFPDQPIPGNIALRMTSERRRLEGLTGSGNPQALDLFDAMVALAQFVQAIPVTLKLDVDELRMSPRGLLLRGRTLDHRGGEQMAAAFSEIPGAACPAPRTERQSDGTVRFALNAQLGKKAHGEDAARPKRVGSKD